MAYILGDAEKSAECIFCSYPAQGPGSFAEHQILWCSERAFAIMNRFPYNNGHLMVMPRAHAADLAELSPEDYQATCELLRRSITIVQQELSAHGVNVGLNLGRAAGAGIDQHCHFHVVPRWHGDTNFMPVTGDVKVLSEHVAATYERLRPAFQKLQKL
jgi:ATP adenylyltransferase